MTHFMTKALIAKHGDAPAAKLEDEKGQRIEGHVEGKGIHPSSQFLSGITDIRASGVDDSDWQEGTMERVAAANRVCAVFGRFAVLLMFALPVTASPHPSLTIPSGRKLAFLSVLAPSLLAERCGQCLTVRHTIVTPYELSVGSAAEN